MNTSRPKIIATLGPTSESPEVLAALFSAGANIIRLNMSHGELADKKIQIENIRKVALEQRYTIGILADLQGPKIRTGKLKDNQPFMLHVGDDVIFTGKPVLSEPGIICTPNIELFEALAPGHRILINDGRMRIDVIKKIDELSVQTVVTLSGELNERKGINLPDTKLLSLSAVTDKDRVDLQFALEQEVEYIALSFVRNAADIMELRTLIKHLHGEHPVPGIIAKIEKPEALEDIDGILRLADGLMVARGDLGVELSYDQVPVAQKQLVSKANEAGKPVIIATQMLETMIHSPQPTRAEASDVANALLDGADALMLSQETAMGDYPVDTVWTMRKIMESVEAGIDRVHSFSMDLHPCLNIYDAMANAACYTAAKAQVKTIVVLSTSGTMGQRVSKLKPVHCEIIVLTPSDRVARKLSLLWGVTSFVIPYADTTDETVLRGEKAMLLSGMIIPGQTVVFCAGKTPLPGASNMVKLLTVGNG